MSNQEYDYPTHAMVMILQYLSDSDLRSASLLSKKWYQVTSRFIWSDFKVTKKNITHLLNHLYQITRFRINRELTHPGRFIKRFDTSALAGYQSYINTSFLHQFNSFLSYKSNGMNHLSDLVLINCHRILPPDIHLLLGSCSNLTFLHIDGLDLNTERAVSSIINRCCPRLKSLWIVSIYPNPIQLEMHGVFLKDIRIEKPRTHKRNRGNDVDDLSLVGVPLQRMCLKHVHVSVESIKYQYLTKFIFVCPPIISNDDILTLIKTSSSLVEFYIEGSMITNSILSQLSKLLQKSNVKILGLVDSQLLTIVGLKCLRDTRLKVLDISKNRHLTLYRELEFNCTVIYKT